MSLTEEELKKLQDPDNWDFENPIQLEAGGQHQAVVPVRLTGEEFQKLEGFAHSTDRKLSTLMHDIVVFGISTIEIFSPGGKSETGH